MYSDGWLLHNKKDACFTRKQLCWKQYQTDRRWLICFWLFYKPILLFSVQRVSLAVVGGTALPGPDFKSQPALFPQEIVFDCNQIKHNKMYRLLQTSFVGCLRVLKSDVVETLRPLSAHFQTNDVALDYLRLMMKRKKCVGEKRTMTCWWGLMFL